MDIKELGKRIKSYRIAAGHTQAELAIYLNCSQVCYSYYEIGRREIPLEVLCRLADFYGTSCDYLLERTDQKNPYPPKSK